MIEDEQSFCGKCGAAFFNIFENCISRKCNDCGKVGYFNSQDQNYPTCFQKHGSYHINIPHISLDPLSGGRRTRLFRPGFRMLIQNIFNGNQITDPSEYIDYAEKLEKDIDTRLMNFDCLQKIDLNNPEHFEPAIEILKTEGLTGSFYELGQSMHLNNCLKAINEGDASNAAFHAHNANTLKIRSILEDEHLNEILWLGHLCYVDVKLNSEANEKISKEKLLIGGATKVIKQLDDSLLYSLSKENTSISQRLSLEGVRDETLISLVEYELQERAISREDKHRSNELSIKRKDMQAKWFFGFFGVAIGMGLKYLIGLIA